MNSVNTETTIYRFQRVRTRITKSAVIHESGKNQERPKQ